MLISFPKILPIKKKQWLNDFKKYTDPNFKKKYSLLQTRFQWTNLKDNQIRINAIAFDTETYASNGNLLCLCNSKNNETLCGSTVWMPQIKDYFQYFKNLKITSNTAFFAWNLKFDAEVILKSLGKKTLEKFYRNDKFKVVYNGFKIIYIPKKHLSISRNKTTIHFYDAMQFYLDSLDNASKKYLHNKKQYDGKYQDKNFPDVMQIKEIEKIADYCKYDCKLTKDLIDLWIDAFYKNFKFHPDKYYSAGYITSQYFKKQLPIFPTFTDIPYEVSNIAYKSYFGGHFEQFSRGYHTKVHHYDIKSAYPYAMSLMPDFLNGKWFKMKNIKQIFSSDAGFFQIKIRINETQLCPLPVRKLSGLVIYPTGEFITHCTLDELKSIMNYDIDIKIISGYIYKSKIHAETKFNHLIKDMYRKRMKQTTEAQKYVYKVLINAGYGKFAQSKPEPRGLFNPVICSYITGKCRSMLLDVVLDNKNDIIMFATDAIMSKKKLKLKIGNQLGNYDYEYHPKFINLMSGIYAFNTKQKSKLRTKNRGFSLKIYDGKTQSTFSLDTHKIEFNEENGFHYSITNKKPLTLVQSIIQKKYSPDQISKMIPVTKKIELNGDTKRVWLGELSSIYDYNESIPIEDNF